MTALALMAAGLAVALWLPGAANAVPTVPRPRWSAAQGTSPRGAGDPVRAVAGAWSAVGVVAAAVVGAELVTWRTGMLAGLVVGTGWAGRRLVAARLADRQAQARSERILEVCGLLAEELRAGQPPGVALARAAQVMPELREVAEAETMGSDVAAALRRSAALPGAQSLRLVAAGWQVGQRSGEGLAAALDRVGESLRAARATQRVVTGELASARATARLLAVLPVMVVVGASGIGAEPWHFLFATGPGLVCLAGGIGLTILGLAWTEALARDVMSRL